MAKHVQQEFHWPEGEGKDHPKAPTAQQPLAEQQEQLAPTSDLNTSKGSLLQGFTLPTPLSEAIEQGAFGMTDSGPMEPTQEEIEAITEEHARELIAILADTQAVDDSIRTGEDPRSGKLPTTDETREKLREFLAKEEPRLKNTYHSALSSYRDAFGEQGARALDLWVRKIVADCTVAPSDRYDPGHPWHYYHGGDNATPTPVEMIIGDIELGQFIERELPKNPAKRRAKMQQLLSEEKAHLEIDKKRYQEIVERGAEALSLYDREIAHTSDEIARATALSLKYNHIRYGLGRIEWLKNELGKPTFRLRPDD